MNIIESAKEAQDKIDQLTDRVSTLAEDKANLVADRNAKRDTIAELRSAIESLESQLVIALSTNDAEQLRRVAVDLTTSASDRERARKLARAQELREEADTLEASATP